MKELGCKTCGHELAQDGWHLWSKKDGIIEGKIRCKWCGCRKPESGGGKPK